MNDTQIEKLKKIVNHRMALVFWIPGDGTGRQVVHVGVAPTLPDEESEPAEVGFLEGGQGQYIALSEVGLVDLVVGKRLEDKDLKI